MSNSLSKDQIKELLPHREPMLLLDELINIKKLHSATAIVNVTKESFFVQGHFPDQSTYENKLVFLMNIEKARFRNPVIPKCKLELKIEAIRSHGRVWKYKGDAFVNDLKMADAIWSDTIVDRK